MGPYIGLLQVVGFDAADEVRLAGRQRLHQGVQGQAELTDQGGERFLLSAACFRIKERVNL